MITDILLVAFKLAMLTFYLGILVYASPLPISRFKRWAPELILDSIYAVLLIALYYFLFDASEALASLIGGSWEAFKTWLSSSLSFVMYLKTLAVLLKSVITQVPLASTVVPLLSPLDRAATTAILFLITVAGIAEIVRNYGLVLMAIGVALYSVPFKLTKGPGAWIIAFILVFNTGLPVLPLFLEYVASPPDAEPQVPLYRDEYVKLVYSPGEPVRGGVLVVIMGGEEVASYLVNSEGSAISRLSGSPPIQLPLAPYRLEHEYLGVAFPLELAATGPQNLRATNKWIKVNPVEGLYAYVVNGEADPRVSEGLVVIEASLRPGGYLEVRYTDSCLVETELHGNATGIMMSGGSWSWRGERGYYERLTASSTVSFNLSIRYSGACDLNVDESSLLDYAEYAASRLDFITPNLLEAFILYYLTVPAMYIFMLFGATFGVARLLGGRDRIPVRVV